MSNSVEHTNSKRTNLRLFRFEHQTTLVYIYRNVNSVPAVCSKPKSMQGCLSNSCSLLRICTCTRFQSIPCENAGMSIQLLQHAAFWVYIYIYLFIYVDRSIQLIQILQPEPPALQKHRETNDPIVWGRTIQATYIYIYICVYIHIYIYMSLYVYTYP